MTNLAKFTAAACLMLTLIACAGQKEIKKTKTPEELYREGMVFYEKGLHDEAEAVFKGIMNDYPASPHADNAHLLLADIYYELERYEESSAYYTTFYSFHPAHPKAPYALFKKGMSHFKQVLSIDRDQTSTKKALIAFDDLKSVYQESPYAEKAIEMAAFLRKRLAESELYVGKFYFKAKNYRGALGRFSIILDSYRDAGMTDEALYYIGESYNHLGEIERAKDAFLILITEFPASPFSKAAKVMVEG